VNLPETDESSILSALVFPKPDNEHAIAQLIAFLLFKFNFLLLKTLNL